MQDQVQYIIYQFVILYFAAYAQVLIYTVKAYKTVYMFLKQLILFGT